MSLTEFFDNQDLGDSQTHQPLPPCKEQRLKKHLFSSCLSL